MTATYAGIGSRKTPKDVQGLLTAAASALETINWTLHTGGATGADEAFYRGINKFSNMKIYIPWEGFGGFTDQDYFVHNVDKMAPSLRNEAFNIAQEHHPVWGILNHRDQLLHARNSFQVLGEDLQSPVNCVICWTEGGKGKGGTGQALRIAKAYDIPIIDLGGLSIEEAENQIQDIIIQTGE